MPILIATESQYGTSTDDLFKKERRNAMYIAKSYKQRPLPERKERIAGGERRYALLTSKVSDDVAIVSACTDGTGYYWGWETVSGKWEQVYGRDAYWMAVKLRIERAQALKSQAQNKSQAQKSKGQ